ncbi:MAG: hypothetical protein ACKPCM_09905 [Pseudanabaena sp.]
MPQPYLSQNDLDLAKRNGDLRDQQQAYQYDLYLKPSLILNSINI